MRAKGQSFAAGAMTLMLSALIVKVIGMLFKIPLTRMLGGEGMGYYMTAFHIFGPICALCVSGFPIAVSRLTAASIACRRPDEPRRILTVALLLLVPVGMFCTLVIYFGAPFFVRLVGNEGSLGAVRAIAPAVLFCCIASVFRGYYEGSRNMVPTAVSQVVEASVKLGAGIWCAMRCLKTELAHFAAGEPVCGVVVQSLEEAERIIAPYAAAAAVIGVTVSTVAGCLVLASCYLGEGNSTQIVRQTAAGDSVFRLIYSLLVIAIPVCAGAVIINISSLIDLMSVMNRLNFAATKDLDAICRSYPQAGLEALGAERVGNFLFGSYSGLALTVFHLVPAVTSSFGVCALPLIASLSAQKNRPALRSTVESVLRITILVALPLGLGMSVMAEPILTLLFANNQAEVSVAVGLLQTLGIAAVLVSVAGCIGSMLQALGKVLIPVRLMLLGAVVKLVVNWVLISQPSISIGGAPWGTVCCYLLILLLGCMALEQEIGEQINLVGLMVRPLLASLFCCAVAKGVLWGFSAQSPRLAAFLAVVAAGVVYALLALGLGAVRQEDLALMPRWRKKPEKRSRNSA